MKYACVHRLTVVAKDGRQTVFRDFELPFPPFVGLTIILDTDAREDAEMIVIESVSYWLTQDIFWCDETDRLGVMECTCDPDDDCCTLAPRIRHLVAEGWSTDDEWQPEMLKDSMQKYPEYEGFRKEWQFTPEQLGVDCKSLAAAQEEATK